MILKIIGIVLLSIIGFALFLVLLVLFVPVRYKGKGYYRNNEYDFKANASWLLHIVSFSYGLKEKEGLCFRLFGIKFKNSKKEDTNEPVKVDNETEKEEEEDFMSYDSLPGSDVSDSDKVPKVSTEESSKGLKAEHNIVVEGGTITIDSYDDAIHSNNLVYLSGGNIQVSSGDDGVHGNETLIIAGANVDVLYSYEGLEAKVVTLESGNVTVNAEDDGVNANEEGSSEFNIHGGYLYINAKGDGLDSNGNVEMTGGTVVVSGPTNNRNGSLDFDGKFNLTGGTLVAAGSTGMFQTPSDSSTQHSIFMTFPSTMKANTLIHVEDSKGNTITTYAPEKDFQAILISSAHLKDGEEYTIYTGGKTDGKAINGYYTKGTYTKGEKVVTFKLSDDITTWVDENGVTEAKKSSMIPGKGVQAPSMVIAVTHEA